MKALFLTCLVAIACSLTCDSPLLNPNFNRLAPLNGVITGDNASVIRNDTVEVCKPLQGQEVCCNDVGFTELKTNFDAIKEKFKTFVTKRRNRIKDMTDKFSDEKTFENVNTILAQNEAIYENDYVKAYSEEKIGEWKEKPENAEKTRDEYPDFKGDPAKFEKHDDSTGKMDCGTLTKEECRAKQQKKESDRDTRKSADEEQKRKDKIDSFECKGDTDQKAKCEARKQREKNKNLASSSSRVLSYLRTLQKEVKKATDDQPDNREQKGGDIQDEPKREAWKKDMNDTEKAKWADYKNKSRATMKEDYQRAVETNRVKRAERTKKVAKKMKDNRRDFIKEQSRCFRRLFKVTIGMGCASCMADQSEFLTVDTTGTDPTFQIKMHANTCMNLKKDCFQYLRLSNVQGRNVLDLKKMKKLQAAKEKLTEKRQAIKDRMMEEYSESDETAKAAHDEKVQTAIKSYEDEFKMAMNLGVEDFQGNASEDAKYGFKMPINCNNETDCEWICENMVRADGIADEAIDSEQTTDMDDASESDGAFDTDIVDDGDDTTEDESGDNVNPIDQRRRLQLEGSSSVIYTVDGFVADDDSYEAGVVVDDPDMNTPIYQADLDPDTPDEPTDKAANSFSVGLSMLIIALYSYLA